MSAFYTSNSLVQCLLVSSLIEGGKYGEAMGHVRNMNFDRCSRMHQHTVCWCKLAFRSLFSVEEKSEALTELVLHLAWHNWCGPTPRDYLRLARADQCALAGKLVRQREKTGYRYRGHVGRICRKHVRELTLDILKRLVVDIGLTWSDEYLYDILNSRVEIEYDQARAIAWAINESGLDRGSSFTGIAPSMYSAYSARALARCGIYLPGYCLIQGCSGDSTESLCVSHAIGVHRVLSEFMLGLPFDVIGVVMIMLA